MCGFYDNQKTWLRNHFLEKHYFEEKLLGTINFGTINFWSNRLHLNHTTRVSKYCPRFTVPTWISKIHVLTKRSVLFPNMGCSEIFFKNGCFKHCFHTWIFQKNHCLKVDLSTNACIPKYGFFKHQCVNQRICQKSVFVPKCISQQIGLFKFDSTISNEATGRWQLGPCSSPVFSRSSPSPPLTMPPTCADDPETASQRAQDLATHFPLHPLHGAY